MMKNSILAAAVISIAMVSCGGAHGDNPGHAYMPDMYYSRAYEAYGYNDVEGNAQMLKNRGIRYNGLIVPGSVARGDMLPTHLVGDTVGLKAADALINPAIALKTDKKLMKEAERIYLVNCGVCHGTALDGNGPLWKGGDGPYPAKPQVLNDANAAKWSDGHIFHVITFGKGQMGSYASQLRPEQRWMVVNYIRSKQTGGASTSADSTSSGAASPTAPGFAPNTGGTSAAPDSISKAQKP